jgi:WD40 repeat protein
MSPTTRRGLCTLLVPALPAAALAQAPHILWSTPAHTQAINSIAWSPDGTLIATGGGDHLVKLWNAQTGAPLGTVASHFDPVNSVAFSSDSALLASGGEDRLIHVVRISDHQGLYTTGLGGFVKSVAFSRDNATLSSGLGYSANEQVQFRVSDGEAVAIIHHHWGTVWSVAYSPDGQYLATSGADSQVFLYSAAATSLLAGLGGHQDDVVAVQFSPDSTLLASAGLYDRTILLHTLPSAALARSIDVGTAMLHALSFSPDGQYLAAAAEEWPTRGRLDIYRVSDGATIVRFTEGTGLNVGAVAYSPTGGAIAFGREDGTLIVASDSAPAPCYPNCDGSMVVPILNVLDFNCFLARFAAADPWANCDHSSSPPALNVLDFNCFLSAFAAGCP